MDGATVALGTGTPEAYFPFGYGRRNCIGSAFALTEIPLVLATVLSGWHVQVARPGAVKPRPTVTLRPRGPVHAYVSRRGHPGTEGSDALPTGRLTWLTWPAPRRRRGKPTI